MSALRRLLAALLFPVLALVSGEVLLERHGLAGRLLPVEAARLARLADYDYVADIEALRGEGLLAEALELARYVAAHPDLPGHGRALALEAELDGELHSLWGWSKRAAWGFLSGEAETMEAAGGAILSDMLLYGDLRDLAKQAYCGATGKETDPLLIALSGVGLLTEVVDGIDWAPAVLKVFRKAGAMTKRFGDWLLTLSKSSVAARRLDPMLKGLFENIRVMRDSVGLPRTMRLFRHVDDGGDAALLARSVSRHGDAAYLAVKNGGEEGVALLRRLDGAPGAEKLLALAARKGRGGVTFLLRPPSRLWVTLSRGARIFHLDRIETFLKDWVLRDGRVLWGVWGAFFAGLGGTALSGRRALKAAGRRLAASKGSGGEMAGG